MSSSQDSPNRTLKAKKKAAANPPSITNPGHAGPTTFFLKTEKEIGAPAERGRSMSRDSSVEYGNTTKKTPVGRLSVDDSSYGVQSLEDAISASYTESSLSRTNSNTTDENAAPGAENVAGITGRKRKAGNPVHPRIAATGQRIISSEHPSTYASATGSPVSLRSAESPLRTHWRRGSATSSINLSQPLTPLKGSPHHDASGPPSTPRTGSPKSFRLSDEEISVASDTGSQAIAPSSGDEEDEVDEDEAVPAAMPQLVMPSIALPARRPFTERGRRMGRLKVMVVGPKRVGKTSLIQSICRVCEDVVHVDAINSGSTLHLQEIGASTKPYPRWRSDVETSQRLRRASLSEGVLERNITFIDTIGTNDGSTTHRIRDHFQRDFDRMSDMQRLSDSEVSDMLGGEGGPQVDVVLFMCDPMLLSQMEQLHEVDRGLLKDLNKWTSVIPLIGRSDTLSGEELQEAKKRLRSELDACSLQGLSLSAFRSSVEASSTLSEPLEPLAVSSALEDDSETMDASVLMNSSYLQPLVPSELSHLVHLLMSPDNIARLRHLSANKFLLWRQSLASKTALPKQQNVLASFPQSAPSSPAISGSGGILGDLDADPSKVLVPHASSSYFRSVSPSASDSSSIGPTKYTLDNIAEPFRQVRLAKWAQDLRRSLDHERNRYKMMYANAAPSEWASSAAGDSEKQIPASDPNTCLTTTNSRHGFRPAKGRLGGEIGVIDPRDPLGLLAFGQAFRRRGWLALQIAGGCGLVGAVCWWVVRNWVEVQEWFSLGGGGEGSGVTLVGGGVSGQTVGVPAAARGAGGAAAGWLEEGMRGARLWEGWFRELFGVEG